MLDEQISPNTANALVQGYCDDFVALASMLGQTLEQASMRKLDLRPSRSGLLRIEQGMRDLAEAIHELLAKPAPTPPAPPAPKERPRTAAGPLARPTRPASPRAEPRSGGLQGTSQSMPVLSVFQFLGRLRKSGCLHIRLDKEELTFVLEQGCIAFATSDQMVPAERLGDLLVDAEACSRDQVDAMKELMDANSSDLFGQQAIDAGIVTHAQVLQALEAQVRHRFARACKSNAATYEFIEGEKSLSSMPFRCQPIAIA